MNGSFIFMFAIAWGPCDENGNSVWDHGRQASRLHAMMWCMMVWVRMY